MKNILLFSILITPFLINTKFEIGTDTPSAHVVFDGNSTNKRLRLPKSNNTSVVNNPNVKLITYDNKATKASAFYDSANWKSMMNMMVPPFDDTDLITYTFLSNEGDVFENNRALPLLTFSSSSVLASKSLTSNISKSFDRNTIEFLKFYNGTKRSLNCVIEIKVFKKRGYQPYFTYKLTNIYLNSYSIKPMTSSINQSEFIEISTETFGMKNNATGFSIAFTFGGNGGRIVPY